MKIENYPPRYRVFYRVSLAINLLFFLLVFLFAYHRKEVINEKIKELFYSNSIPSEELLSQFNNDPLSVSNELYDIEADSTITFLFLGNSLTYTSVDEEVEEDKTVRGLASSCKEKDFVHQFVKMVAEGDSVNVDFSIINIADFERNFKKCSFTSSKITNARNKTPDWLIVQIGENIAVADLAEPEIFIQECEKLFSLFPNSRKMITIPFWTKKEKSYALTNVAINNNALLIDLSHLGNGSDDENNLANSQKKYKHSIAGTHPGDYGMTNIALCFYAGYKAFKSYN